MIQTSKHLPRAIYSVSSLTSNIKQILEEKYPIIWISGEISNLRIPYSGHAYFTLKDENAQIAAVVFKGQQRQLGFELQDGTTIVGMGRISVYEPRGTYQIILEYIEPQGVGALQLAFEQLKRKLEAEGMFDLRYKHPLPMLPRKIGVVTSPSGSVIRDIINVSHRRFPNLAIEVLSVRVQGPSAPAEIVKAILKANEVRSDLDVLILARGGGSLEDLAAFNDEEVARAVFNSKIPVISAIGHETDFTITDFVADLRAPTPSAAAEMAIPVKSELIARCLQLQERCLRAVQSKVQTLSRQYQAVQTRILRPYRSIQERLLVLDDYEQRLQSGILHHLKNSKIRHIHQERYLYQLNIGSYIVKYKVKYEHMNYKLKQYIQNNIDEHKQKLYRTKTALKALSPMAVLLRGYSITRTIPEKTVLMDAQNAFIGQELEVLLASGAIQVKVQKNN